MLARDGWRDGADDHYNALAQRLGQISQAATIFTRFFDPSLTMSGEIASRFLATRRFTEQICRPLAIEDFVVQAMPDASPTRWHLAHSTWFFETFVLARWLADYQPFSAEFHYLFNSWLNKQPQ